LSLRELGAGIDAGYGGNDRVLLRDSDLDEDPGVPALPRRRIGQRVEVIDHLEPLIPSQDKGLALRVQVVNAHTLGEEVVLQLRSVPQELDNLGYLLPADRDAGVGAEGVHILDRVRELLANPGDLDPLLGKRGRRLCRGGRLLHQLPTPASSVSSSRAAATCET